VSGRAWLALGLAAAINGCASSPVTRFVHVNPPPRVTALAGQTPRDQQWDITDCQAEAGSRTDYNPSDSPFANLLRRVFFWGTSGAALGGTVEGGFPTVIDESEASTGLIVGASAGGAVGAATSWTGSSRYERAWVSCMESRAYRVEPPEATAPPAPATQPVRP
jgi:hypothetical protein